MIMSSIDYTDNVSMGLKNLTNRRDVAALLKIEYRTLCYVLYEMESEKNIMISK